MTVELYKPFDHQKAVHNAISRHIEFVERGSDLFQKVFCVKSCRQVGKSALAQNELARFALHFNNTVSAYVTTSFRLCRKMYKGIIKMFEGTGIIVSTNSSGLEIKFLNGSSIEFFPQNNGINYGDLPFPVYWSLMRQLLFPIRYIMTISKFGPTLNALRRLWFLPRILNRDSFMKPIRQV